MTNDSTSLIQWQCQQLLNRVVTLTDQAQWEQLAECYSEDAVLIRPSDPQNGIVGRDNIKASFLARPPRTSCHLLTNCVFTVETPERVVATSRVLLLSGPARKGSEIVSADASMMAGSFTDQLVLVNQQWKIARREGSIELKYSYPNTGGAT